MCNENLRYLRCISGNYYFVRRVPKDLQNNYSSNRISQSLKTKSKAVAIRARNSIAQRLDDYWLGLRLQMLDIPSIHLLKSSDERKSLDGFNLADALDLYLKLKGSGRHKVFSRTASRNVEYVIDALGMKPISEYSSSDGAMFRDYLLKRHMSIRTVKRVFSSVRAIVNLAISERGLKCINGFAKTYFPEDEAETQRTSISIEKIRKIQSLCKTTDDEMRWLIGLISDTGMRLGEAVGLLKEDIITEGKIPYVDLKPHSWRSLKTKGSRRKIPLTGVSLWAAYRIKEFNQDSRFCFPRYCNETFCKTNSASGALNKWLQCHASKSAVIHGFRHSMRDRLRALECPSDIVDAIGGWRTAGVGQGYGKGYPLEVLHKWMLEF